MMKKYFLITSTLIFGCVLTTFAQEEQPFPEPVQESQSERRMEQQTNPRESGMQMWEMERVQRETSQSAETTAQRRKEETTVESRKKESPEKGEKVNEESVLTFNFLYYLIQKFKLSETVD